MSTFVIPLLFLQCLAWPAHDGETINNFRFEQPVTITVTNASSVVIKDSDFDMHLFCPAVVANDFSSVSMQGTFNITGALGGIIESQRPLK